jgi:short subunit dehydrogenase-like uncharacterized protein
VRAVSVVLYGASGYTGRLVGEELGRRGVEHVLSGRDPAKLDPLGAERGAPVSAVTLDDESGLRELLRDASVVINCAGPFTLAGDALVRAAIDMGTHYVDSTGEQPFIRMVFERHGARAEEAGVALVPAVGFDYLPGDFIARLAAEGLEPLEELVIAYAVKGFGMSRGTLRSGLEIMKGGDVIYEDGDWRPAPTGVFRASFDFPQPLGRQGMSRYPSGEVITDRRRRPWRGRPDEPGRGARRGRLRPDRRDPRPRRRAAERAGLRPRGGARAVGGLRPRGVPQLPRRSRGVVAALTARGPLPFRHVI